MDYVLMVIFFCALPSRLRLPLSSLFWNLGDSKLLYSLLELLGGDREPVGKEMVKFRARGLPWAMHPCCYPIIIVQQSISSMVHCNESEDGQWHSSAAPTLPRRTHHELGVFFQLAVCCVPLFCVEVHTSSTRCSWQHKWSIFENGFDILVHQIRNISAPSVLYYE